MFFEFKKRNPKISQLPKEKINEIVDKVEELIIKRGYASKDSLNTTFWKGAREVSIRAYTDYANGSLNN